MNIKQVFRTGLGVALVSVVSVQAVAFMNTVEPNETAKNKLDFVQLVDTIADELNAEEVDCGEMLTKMDQVLDRIDETLDAGVVDEESLLVSRDALVRMRLELPCLSDHLAQDETLTSQIAPTNVVSDALVGGPIVDGACCGGAVAAGAGGGGGGGGAVAGGNGLRRLLLIGGVTGGIVAIASSGDDNPPSETSL